MYIDRRRKRSRDYLDVNEFEMSDAKRAALLAGMQYGEWKRYALNKVTQELLRQRGEEITAGPHEF